MTTRQEYEDTSKKLLKYVDWYWDRYGFGPSYRSIGKAIGISGTASVHKLVQHLLRRGYLVRNPVNHSIRVVNTGDPETCRHDWRVRKISNPLKVVCADCLFTTEVEYAPAKDCDPKELLKYPFKV